MDGKIVLAVDTTAALASYAVARNRTLIAALCNESQAPHSQSFFGNLQTLLTKAGLSLTQIDLFAGVTGPGSFTGLRVGLSALKGLAQAAQCRILGVNTIDLTALSVGVPGEFIVVLEAGRNEVIVAKRSVSHRMPIQTIAPDVVVPITELSELLSAETSGASIIGPESLRSTLNYLQRCEWPESSLAVTLALYADDFLENDPNPELHAYYLRPSDAEIKYAKKSI
ncbi:MAG: tRNA (adenosine(37)-N6)-threonylcarbamoyltransferase complex dimerization subunit type 1 TsaB [Acidobacteria bacterium]|nr:tRNA (adenosine(37)-N6)-threonylcarbamoyltransferase complex dimerization subunit type 1 TsaB [Acidobacteriota bacterium]MBI3422888.1 tRNA (adenosine(37)-N6)-threonylcarbamoyltransferase complex dimerization subunit type 1 TsaB [Acidobacteriota bacterium]